MTWLSLTTKAEGKTPITSSLCTKFYSGDIPVADFHQPVPLPFTQLRITQKYNTTKAEGFCLISGSFANSNSPVCKGKIIHYGHDGLDLNPLGAKDGQYDVHSISKGLVLASTNRKFMGSWGETIIIASRTNLYSTQILTFHYYHLHATGDPNGKKYTTSRQVNACDHVIAGEVLAKEGNTNGWPVHLHVTIRRWSNWQELQQALINSPSVFYGYGYARNRQYLLANYLDPEGFLTNTWRDLNHTAIKGNVESLFLRSQGIEFGLWNGNFGFNKTVSRSEMARWVKIAAQVPNQFSTQANFIDVGNSHPDFPYIQALLQYPKHSFSVLNAEASCLQVGNYFCPNKQVTEAEALKMIILAFYPNQYLQTYADLFWYSDPTLAQAYLSTLNGIDTSAWYAPFFYFAYQQHLIGDYEWMNAAHSITRRQAVIWLTKGMNKKLLNSSTGCGLCLSGQYCNLQNGQCDTVPSCISTEGFPCPVGGGNIKPDKSPVCTPGQIQKQTCNNGGHMIKKCDSVGQWGNWSTCQQSAVCVSGQVQTIFCSLGSQTRSCFPNGQWSSWSACQSTGECSPGQTDTQICSGGWQHRTCNNNRYWEGWSACQISCNCQSGDCCDGCHYKTSSTLCSSKIEYQCAGQNSNYYIQYHLVKNYCTGDSAYCDGLHHIGLWQTYHYCSSQESCQFNGPAPICVQQIQDAGTPPPVQDAGTPPPVQDTGTPPPVQDTGTPPPCHPMLLASSENGCYTNHQNSGSPTLCLEISADFNTIYRFRVCKQGGAFQNTAAFELYDDNHVILLKTGQINAGNICSNWAQVNLSYLTQNGPQNGAGLKAKILSPSNCQNSDCTYYTGYKTVYRTCQ